MQSFVVEALRSSVQTHLFFILGRIRGQNVTTEGHADPVIKQENQVSTFLVLAAVERLQHFLVSA